MKKYLASIYYCAILITFFGCNKKILPSAEVNFISGIEGTITVRAIGIGDNKDAAITDAENNAFDVLFFRGLPESDQKIPLIGPNENEERLKNKAYFDEFYKGRYKTFVMSSILSSAFINCKGGKKSIAVDIKINLSALRRDLEQNNIIRKFGF